MVVFLSVWRLQASQPHTRPKNTNLARAIKKADTAIPCHRVRRVLRAATHDREHGSISAALHIVMRCASRQTAANEWVRAEEWFAACKFCAFILNAHDMTRMQMVAKRNMAPALPPLDECRCVERDTKQALKQRQLDLRRYKG